MGRRRISRTVLIFVIVLIGTMIGTFYYEKIELREQSRNFDLFSLVPEESEAVMEVKDVHRFFNTLESTSYYPRFMEAEGSQLIRLLYRNIGLLSEQKTHGLSGRVNRMLVSYHSPGSGRDQVIYAQLSRDDHSSLKSAFEKSGLQKSLAKKIKYKGENLWIVPLNNDEFLVTYIRQNFCVFSYQKHLVERVVDTYLKDAPSLNKEVIFRNMTKSHEKSHTSTFFYMRARPICAWAEFTVRLHNRSIYLIGEGHADENVNAKALEELDANSTSEAGVQDETHSNATSLLADSLWASTLYRGRKVHLDGARFLPEKTVVYGLCSIDHLEVLPISLGKEGVDGKYTLKDYLNDYAEGEVQWTRFEDDSEKDLLSVASFPLRLDVTPLDAKWNALCSEPGKLTPINGTNYVRCTLDVEGESVQATVWNRQLLLSTSGWKGLERYIRAAEHGEEREVLFGEEDADMFQDFNLTVYGNLGTLLKYPHLFRGPLTRSLFHNQELFRHFTASAQLLFSEEHYYINLLFTYVD